MSNLTGNGQGFAVRTADRGALELILNDGRTESRWTSEPGTLRMGGEHHIVVTADGGPKIITFVADGRLQDGGDFRQFGWGRFSPHLRSVNGEERLKLDPAVRGLRIYGRALKTAEAIGRPH